MHRTQRVIAVMMAVGRDDTHVCGSRATVYQLHTHGGEEGVVTWYPCMIHAYGGLDLSSLAMPCTIRLWPADIATMLLAPNWEVDDAEAQAPGA